ncbi:MULTISPECIES: NAD(P)H-binding protein [Microbacterium]|uniref:NAD(P)H-binding protein n=1 Tax=Microbacterium TaxID=33882 RepID=UPI0010F78E24|nr:NAD(P)H-binding protein [Microbacterium sp. 4NA327F11]MCK9917429.1 NAD(P)H-binding protein [Microbacteriaceae bacterium K1510]
MTILVTGASGHLGRLVVERLLARGAAASDIVAGARTPAKAADLGVRVVELDYTKPETVAAALEGVDRVLLISSSEVGQRAAQHQVVIDAAVAAGVELLAYTSIYRAGESTHILAPEHVETEAAIAASGVPAVLLRNNWYTENQLADVQYAGTSGVLAAAAGDGRIASASRVDYADAAAAVLLADDQAGRVYELAGDVAWSYDDLAAAAAAIFDREVAYVRQTVAERAAALEAAGLDAGTAGFVAAMDASTAEGQLDGGDGSLAALIGRPTTPLVEGLRAAL